MTDVVAPVIAPSESSPVEGTTPPVVKHKLVINGTEEEVAHDEVIRLAQQGRAGQKALKEKAELEKKYKNLESRQREAFANLNQKGIDKLLKQFPNARNIDELFQAYTQAKLDDASLTPEQKKIRELEAYKKSKEASEQVELTKRQEQEVSQLADQYEAQMIKDIETAVQKSGLPLTAKTFDLFGHYMELAYDQGKIDITAADVLPLVEQDLNKNAKHFIPKTEKDLYNYIGKDQVEKLLAYHLEQGKVKPEGDLEQPIVVKKGTSHNKREQRKSFSDWKRGK